MGDLILVLLVLFVLPGIAVVVSYNRFVGQIASIDATWAGIDVELQRRHDLVDNLVRTVEGYADHERTTLDLVTTARSRAIQATSSTVPVEDQARAEDALTDGLSSLLAITEDFPDLKADRAFRDLQQQLVETEDRITASRRLYNLEVAAYERRRRAVPSNVIADAFSFEARKLFEIQDAAAAHAAQVSFPPAAG
jgi:LemA protein